MSSNDEIKEDKYLNKQQNLADYNSSSFSYDDEEEEKCANYGKSHNFVSDDVVQEDDLPGDVCWLCIFSRTCSFKCLISNKTHAKTSNFTKLFFKKHFKINKFLTCLWNFKFATFLQL